MTPSEPMTRGYRIALRALWPVVRRWGRLDVSGLEHLPASGPVLLAGNHDSYWDPLAIGIAALERRQIRALAKAELWKVPGLGPVLDSMGRSPSAAGAATRRRSTGRWPSCAPGPASASSPRGPAPWARAARPRRPGAPGRRRARGGRGGLHGPGDDGHPALPHAAARRVRFFSPAAIAAADGDAATPGCPPGCSRRSAQRCLATRRAAGARRPAGRARLPAEAERHRRSSIRRGRLKRPDGPPDAVRMRLLCRYLALTIAALLLTPPAAQGAPSVTEFTAGLRSASAPTGIAAGSDGAMWFTDTRRPEGSGASRSPEVTRFTEGLSTDSRRFASPGPDGNLWFTEKPTRAGSGASRRRGSSGVGTRRRRCRPGSPRDPTATSGSPAGQGRPHRPHHARRGEGLTSGLTKRSAPTSITAAPDGLWFTESVRRIGRITPAGVITEFPLPGAGAPLEITSGPDGNLWFTVGGEPGQVGRITPSGDVAFPAWPQAQTRRASSRAATGRSTSPSAAGRRSPASRQPARSPSSAGLARGDADRHRGRS